MRLALAACSLALTLACRPVSSSVDLQIEPSPPRAGSSTTVRITIKQGDVPLAGATVTVEAHMSHPGMAPVVSKATDRGHGVYEAQVQLTMAGDWTFVANARLPGGGRLTKNLHVPGVRPAASSH